jgi:hypothetical protein
LEDWQTDVAIEQSRARWAEAIGRRHRVPSGGVQDDVLAPDEKTDPIDEGQQQDLCQDRVPEPVGGGDRSLEPRYIVPGHEVSLEELPEERLPALLRHLFRRDQQGQSEQEARMNLEVQQEGDRNRAAAE